MNEQIRQLAQEVGISVEYLTNTKQIHLIEKFAELIVQECVEKIETYQIPVGNSAAGEMAAKWTYASLKELRDDIKHHFGIEE